MQLLNHHQRPCDPSSLGYALIIIVSFVLRTTLADYDCSAKEDGWYYDPDFCHIYWRCIHGTSEEFECHSGTAWDHIENRCNWLDSVDCLRAEKTTEEVTLEDEGEGEEPNDDINVEDDESTRKPRAPNRKLDNSDEDSDLSAILVCQVNASAEIFCAGRDGFFAHPEYCTRYYRCAHGVDQGFECPKGTAWDEETKSCAWIDQVNCEEKKLGYSTTPITTEDTTTTTSSRTTSDTESISSTSRPSLIRPAHGKGVDATSPIECQPTGIYVVPDPTECNSYYQCDKGTRIQLNCPEGQLFDAHKRQCMDFERVICGSRPSNLIEKNQCINKRDGIHPDTERDCHYYYQCVSQTKMREAKCMGDQKYISYLSRCAAPSLAPMPCGSFIVGSASREYHRNIALLISFLLTMIVCIIGDH